MPEGGPSSKDQIYNLVVILIETIILANLSVMLALIARAKKQDIFLQPWSARCAGNPRREKWEVREYHIEDEVMYAVPESHSYYALLKS